MSGYDLFVGKVSLIYPHANYEWRYEDSTLRQFHYLENGILVLKENNNDFWYFRILTDNVGSVVRVIDSEGTAVVEVSYDAWGKPTVALNQMAFPRGFGGHEMLTKYRLVNMDGRLYDYDWSTWTAGSTTTASDVSSRPTTTCRHRMTARASTDTPTA